MKDRSAKQNTSNTLDLYCTFEIDKSFGTNNKSINFKRSLRTNMSLTIASFPHLFS